MPTTVQLQLLPEQIHNHLLIKQLVKDKLNLKQDNFTVACRKRSIDARRKQIIYNCSFEVYQSNEALPSKPHFEYKNVKDEKVIAIIGAGPAGLFAALRCLELGIKPVVFERGKDVRSRRRDLAILNKKGIVNEDSNYCFGEGGAGTYSDGKLYTRSKKRGDVQRALETFVHFGASEEILIDAHPHIGTNKLPQIIVSMREEIINKGGEIHFVSKLTDIKIANDKLEALEINHKEWYPFENVILATGHSARDIYYLLHKIGVRLEAKPFALGVRVEHAQEFIDKMQYHGRKSDEYLPPASYSLVTQVEDRGVYSFCMCPGGIIAPCATSQGELVTNGWSPSKRNNPYANSGIVVAIFPSDFPNFREDPFVCLNFQKEVEQKAFEAGGGDQKSPAQRLKDFLNGVKSPEFPRSSYQPGITSVKLDEIFPSLVTDRLKKAFLDFDKKIKGFVTNDAVLHAPESRTSSPVLIPRDPDSFQHPDVLGLYPCAEGAGYAGGIISAAIDGVKCVDAIEKKMKIS